MNCDLKWRVLVMNTRYIFAVSCHKLIHGGFSHRPPHVRSWFLFGVYLVFLDLYVSICAPRGKSLVIGLYLWLLQSRVPYHLMTVCHLLLSLLIPKHLPLNCKTCGSSRRQFFGENGARYYRQRSSTTAAWGFLLPGTAIPLRLP